MAKDKLTALTVKNLVSKGARARTGDGGGLYIDVRGAGSASWLYRYMIEGKAREMGLGRYPDIDLAAARDLAEGQRRLVAQKIDPLEERDATRVVKQAAKAAAAAQRAAAARTFKTVAAQRLDAKEAEYGNAKHRDQWRSTLASYVYPVFGDKPVAEVDQADVLAALTPIWQTKTETAVRTRQRIEAILDYAAVQGWRSAANPARWKGQLEHLLASPRKARIVRHHPALPWAELPGFMAALKAAPGIGSLALQFAILTAARSGEVRGATWGEIDLDAGVWTVPGSRMKAGKEHRVPLNAMAVDVLARAKPFRVADTPTDLVFPSVVNGGPISDMTLAAVIKRLNMGEQATWVDQNGVPVVPHGFRSTFRDWCAELRDEPAEVVEMALAHTIKNATEAAYRRGDLFDKRIGLMDAWSDHCRGDAADNVRHIRGSRRK
jgi:integrase